MSETTSGGKTTDSLNGKLTFEQDKNRIVGRDEDNKARLLISANGDDFSMKVAKDGEDALTGGNDDLIFNSSQNVFKIVASSTATINATSASAGSAIVTTVPHGLSYVPAFLAYYSGSGTYYQLPNSVGWGASGGSVTFLHWIFASTDATNLYLTMIPSASGNLGTYPVKYYLLQESAN